MTKNTFRQYRVLGKGGFGEVSDHDFLYFQGTRHPQASLAPGGRFCWLVGLWVRVLGIAVLLDIKNCHCQASVSGMAACPPRH